MKKTWKSQRQIGERRGRRDLDPPVASAADRGKRRRKRRKSMRLRKKMRRRC